MTDKPTFRGIHMFDDMIDLTIGRSRAAMEADAAWIVSRIGAVSASDIPAVLGVSTGGWGHVTWRPMRSRKESRRRAQRKRFVSFQDYIRANPLPGPINRKIGQEP